MSLSSSEIQKAIEIIASCVRSYLKSAHGIVSVAQLPTSGKADALALRDVTAIIGLGGAINNLVTVSFDQALLAHLLTLETQGLVVPDNDQPVFVSKKTLRGKSRSVQT